MTHVGGTIVIVRTNLVILAVFPKLTKVVGDVRIEANERALRMGDDAFAAFPSLAEIGGALVLERHDVLEQFEGFEALRTVGGGVRIANNRGLRRIAPRDDVKRIPWVGALLNVGQRVRTSSPPFTALRARRRVARSRETTPRWRVSPTRSRRFGKYATATS